MATLPPDHRCGEYQCHYPPDHAFGGQAVATRIINGSSTLYYIHNDHLGSNSRMSTSAGSAVADSTARYTPFGDWRTEPTASLTDRGYTGHLHNNLGSGSDDLGLIYMNARYYLPASGRFISPDTIVPEITNPQSFNRYSYVLNSPLNFIDPSGHISCDSQYLDGQDQAACSNPHYVYPSKEATIVAGKVVVQELEIWNANVTYTFYANGDWDARPIWTYEPNLEPVTENKIIETDYASLSLSFGPGVGPAFSIKVDKYKNVYFSAGGQIGTLGASSSLTFGSVYAGASIQDLESVDLDEETLENVMTGWSVGASGGILIGNGFSGGFYQDPETQEGYLTVEPGFYSPQASASGSKTVILYDANGEGLVGLLNFLLSFLQ